MPSSATSPWNDPATLRDMQYSTDTNLAARQSIYDFQQPRHELPARVFEALALQGTETIADVGCGNGLYLAALDARAHRGTVVGLDLSPGMLTAARPRAPHAELAAADAMRLPLADATIDVALAMHMLYHVPEPTQALSELRRVVKPDGRAVVVLNGTDHLGQIRAMAAGVAEAVGFPLPHRPPRLTLDVGEGLVLDHFGSVSRMDFTGELVIPGPEPVIGYICSMIGFEDLDDRNKVHEEVQRRMPADGPFRVATQTGALICR